MIIQQLATSAESFDSSSLNCHWDMHTDSELEQRVAAIPVCVQRADAVLVNQRVGSP